MFLLFGAGFPESGKQAVDRRGLICSNIHNKAASVFLKRTRFLHNIKGCLKRIPYTMKGALPHDNAGTIIFLQKSQKVSLPDRAERRE